MHIWSASCKARANGTTCSFASVANACYAVPRSSRKVDIISEKRPPLRRGARPTPTSKRRARSKLSVGLGDLTVRTPGVWNSPELDRLRDLVTELLEGIDHVSREIVAD